MTIIAWDGKTLAADKLADAGDCRRSVVKIQRLRRHLVGCAGDFSRAVELMDWFDKGADPATYPAEQRDKDKYTDMLVITPQGRATKYELAALPIVFEDEKIAIGSGRDYAMAAMALGQDARAAVLLTSKLCASCGNGVDTLTLES